jgi:hypothetical protein
MYFLFLSGGGFLAMLGGAVLAVGIPQGRPRRPQPTAEPEPDKGRFTGRMEERFRRRFEQD